MAVTHGVRLPEGLKIRRAGPESGELREKVAADYLRNPAVLLRPVQLRVLARRLADRKVETLQGALEGEMFWSIAAAPGLPA